MRIEKMFVPKTQTSPKGLDEINLTSKPLGPVVALVGKNGAGKSRILDFVRDYLRQITIEDFFSDYITNIPTQITAGFESNISSGKNRAQMIRNSNNQNEKSSFRSTLTNETNNFFSKFRTLGRAYIKVVDNDDLKLVKQLVNNQLPFEQILNNAHFEAIKSNPALVDQAENNQSQHPYVIANEFKILNSVNTLDYLLNLTNGLLKARFNLYIDNEERPDFIKSEFEKNKANQRFKIFQNYVREFLGGQFTYKQNEGNDGFSSIHLYNGRPFNLNQLSPGQKTLFAYAVLFFYLDVNSNANIKDSIIIIDEPEKHLHPEAQITLMNALKRIVKDSGQLWIATHSVNILSHLEYDEILLVKENSVSQRSSSIIEDSFKDLMGLEDHIEELRFFVSDISKWAYGNFMRQCFKEPDVVFAKNINDPQFKSFKDFIGQSSLRVLDFGAGLGRIGYTINEDAELRKRIDYYGYEPDNKKHQILSQVPGIKGLYQTLDSIPNLSFEIVLLCNVLHEISPLDWVKTIDQAREKLGFNGRLVIIEDKYLPKGETAHEFGYLILDSDQQRRLMDAPDSVELTPNDEKYAGRIVFNVFKKENLNPSTETIIYALEGLRDKSLANIRSLRKVKRSLNQGRLYANQTQLYINSLLALETLQER